MGASKRFYFSDGLIGDDTGSIKFVKWAKASLPDLELGKSYLLKKAVTDEFQGRFSVKLNRASQIEPIDREIEAKGPKQNLPRR